MMGLADDFFDPELAAMVEAELTRGERVEWMGRPIAGRMAIASLPMALGGIFYTAFFCLWIAMAGGIVSGGAWGLFPLWGVPFVLVGLGMLTLPIWMYRKATRTAYAITDRRAISIEPGLFGWVVVRSFEPTGLAILARTQNADGSGSLIFRREYRGQNRYGARFVDIGFFAVPDVRDVEDRIRALIRRADDPGFAPR